MKYKPKLIKRVKRVYNDKQTKIYEFAHSGPSRSEEVTVKVILTPDENGEEENAVCTTIAVYHHEGAYTTNLSDLEEHIKVAQDNIKYAEEKGDMESKEFATQEYLDWQAIQTIVLKIVDKY